MVGWFGWFGFVYIGANINAQCIVMYCNNFVELFRLVCCLIEECVIHVGMIDVCHCYAAAVAVAGLCR